MSANSPRPDPRKEVLPASDEDESSNHDDEDGYKDDAENAHNLVPCPSCQNNMKAWQVFQHLEACPGPNSQTTSSEIVRNSAALQIPQLRHHKTVERLPALNYSMLKEQALRKKLAEMGISNQGPRILLEQRHREWITIWNANCDSAQPRNRQQLLQDLDVWEKTQGYRSTTAGRTPSSIIAIKDKKFDGTAWAARHDSSFKDLIASARKSRMNIKPSFKYEDERGEKVESLPHDLTTKRRGLFMDMDKTKNPALELQGHLLTSGELLNDVGSHPDMANEELLDQ
ncbi:E3 ubiquitin-protein ligase rad18 [Conoideocrella luteorostrata]|uniref:E3 ubiquitin-protein ligase rad18 n=1 Tax=Conoideocrella luteorostrata TaxID=1105319 RepID=A0AAJ0FW77_9HYPO|nr:E3 ubiquitin-protein ligase rad18 [Conoideocrella luteorostrata]